MVNMCHNFGKIYVFGANEQVVMVCHDAKCNHIVINAGRNHGISKDQSLEIFVPGEEVIDPDTGGNLGILDFIKAYLNVKDVFPKMSICENSETKTKNFLSPFNNLSIEETLRLNVDSQEISGGLSGSRKIRIGDMVRESR